METHRRCESRVPIAVAAGHELAQLLETAGETVDGYPAGVRELIRRGYELVEHASELPAQLKSHCDKLEELKSRRDKLEELT